jgi:hypothetical protein
MLSLTSKINTFRNKKSKFSIEDDSKCCEACLNRIVAIDFLQKEVQTRIDQLLLPLGENEIPEVKEPEVPNDPIDCLERQVICPKVKNIEQSIEPTNETKTGNTAKARKGRKKPTTDKDKNPAKKQPDVKREEINPEKLKISRKRLPEGETIGVNQWSKQCRYCDEIFDNCELVVEHSKANHGNSPPLVCHFCLLEFGLASDFISHVLYEELKQSDEGSFTCGICDHDFVNPRR